MSPNDSAAPGGALPSLVADVGGTNTRVALAGPGGVVPGSVRRYANAGRASLGAVLAAYLAEERAAVGAVCVAVAGPVRDGVGRMTNLDWRIDAADLAGATGATRVAVLNDLAAQGHALGQIPAAALRPVLQGRGLPGSDAAQLVIGIGTGFNAAPVHPGPGGRVVPASECGHVTLPVRSAEELALMRHLETAHGFAGVEDALSGRGIERLDAWLASTGSAPAVAPREAEAILAALAAGEARAEAVAALAVRLIGRVAGDLALTHLPFGGIYLIGGVARAFAPHLDRFGFAAAFRDKGRFSDFMSEFSIFVVEDDFAALTGCARFLATAPAG